jgi:septum formation protein
MTVILASSSPYRAELLRRLLPHFEQRSPDVEEQVRPGETPQALAQRLAIDKAEAVALHAPDALVIGSDQVAELEGRALGKPRDRASACQQLLACSGRSVAFHTAVCLIDTRGPSLHMHTLDDCTRVRFRALDAATIDRYITREQPLDCAGSFKCEGLGISLFEAIESTDPTALVGLPLIGLSRLLRDCGLEVP